MAFTVTKDLILPSTVTGSWPRPRWFDVSMWGKPLDTCMMDIRFREKFQDALAIVISDEERAGLDILTHGDFHCDEDFAGLRTFHAGDSLRRVAWKAYARGQGLHVKMYAGTSVASHLFDWDSLPGLGVEARLSQLCRWIEDAHAEGRAFGLKLPDMELPANIGPAHRQRCLTALALYGLEGSR